MMTIVKLIENKVVFIEYISVQRISSVSIKIPGRDRVREGITL